MQSEAAAKLELWFFRDMLESNRLRLFELFGFKPPEMDTMAKQQMVFRRILDALSTDAEPVETAPDVAVKALEWVEGTFISTDDDNGPLEGVPTKLKSWRAWPSTIIRQRHQDGLFLLRGKSDGVGIAVPLLETAKAAAQADYEARIRSALSAQVQDVAENDDLNENALSLAAQAYQRKFRDMLDPAPTEEPKAGGGPLGYAIRAYLSSVSLKMHGSDFLESNPQTLRWWCQQLLDIIENYDISHDAPEEEIALLNDIRSAVDPAYNQGGAE